MHLVHQLSSPKLFSQCEISCKVSKHSTEFTYSDFPCHLKVNRYKLALIKKGKGWRLPPVHSWKLTNTTFSPALFPAVSVTVVRDRKIRTAPGTNQIAGFVTMLSREKIYLWYWTSILWSTDTCQKQGIRRPVSHDHMAGSRFELIEVTYFFEVNRWPSTGFIIGSRAQTRLTYCNHGRAVWNWAG